MSALLPQDMRREMNAKASTCKAGLLQPVMAVPLDMGEGAMLNQSVTLELEPLAGRMLTPVTAEMFMVFVPTAAIDAIKAPAAAYAGVPEVVKEKLLTGAPLFGLETEGVLTQRLGIEALPVAGVKKVCENIRLAHNVAVNFLRKRRYAYAVEILHTNTAITPALLSQTVLDRLLGVLNPEERVNGAVQLDLPSVQLPVEGIGLIGSPTNMSPGVTTARGKTTDEDWQTSNSNVLSTASISAQLAIRTFSSGATMRPNIFAELNGIAGGNISLTDFANAQYMDRITRAMRSIIDENPVDGEEQVLRWAFGLTLEPGRNPYLLAERSEIFGQARARATDGVGMVDDVSVSKMVHEMSISVPVPKTELGGVVITFISVKPDEMLLNQPHPVATRPFGMRNRISERMKLDPVPVTMREVNGDVGVGSETTVAFYTGANALAKSYVSYGFTKDTNPANVENKIAIWQYAIPASVTPENVIYPASISQYPFQNSAGDICRYHCASVATISTPEFFGPSPVETVAVITSSDLFNEV